MTLFFSTRWIGKSDKPLVPENSATSAQALAADAQPKCLSLGRVLAEAFERLADLIEQIVQPPTTENVVAMPQTRRRRWAQ